MRAKFLVSAVVAMSGCVGAAGKPGDPGAMGDPGEPGAMGSNGDLTGAIGPAQFAKLPAAEVFVGPDTPIPTGVVTKVAMSGATYDTAGIFDDAQPTRLTAPVDGIYLVTAGVKWRASGGGTQRFATLRDKTGEDIGIAQVAPVNSASQFTSEIVSVQTPLAKGDFLELLVLQDSGATVNLVNGLTFQMTWVAPKP
jgi:hypothetical protein